jgi:hypothetical protein
MTLDPRPTSAWLLPLLLTIGQVASAACGPELTARLASRAPSALAGAAFIASIENLETEEREAAIVSEVLSGNVPSFLRTLVPVVVNGSFRQWHEPVAAIVCVMPDYLAIGSDQDFVRIPMNLRSSTTIARALGFILPTGKIVDAIHAQAAYRFQPQPLKPGPQMILPDYFLVHEKRIRSQGLRDGAPLGALLAGHKKDVVLSNLLNRRDGRLAIYGWHERDGSPIQPLSTAHHAGYADYSHGIRLVSASVEIAGLRYSAYDVLQDGRRAELLSSEGAIANAPALMGAETRDLAAAAGDITAGRRR